MNPQQLRDHHFVHRPSEETGGDKTKLVYELHMGQSTEKPVPTTSPNTCRACTEGRGSPVPGKKHCSTRALN